MNHPGKMRNHANTIFSHVDFEPAWCKEIKVQGPFRIVGMDARYYADLEIRYSALTISQYSHIIILIK
jgi:hypothetical protein